MQTFIEIFYGILLFGIGFGIIKYRKQVKSWTGNFVWAEQYIGRGGTYFIMLLLGLFLMFLGVIYPFGGLDMLGGGSDSKIFQDPGK